jgi:hypothetical protein
MTNYNVSSKRRKKNRGRIMKQTQICRMGRGNKVIYERRKKKKSTKFYAETENYIIVSTYVISHSVVGSNPALGVNLVIQISIAINVPSATKTKFWIQLL